MRAVRKTAGERGLNRLGTRLDEPCAVGNLGAEQILDALAVRGIGRLDRAALAQRDQRFARRVGIGQLSVVELRPAAIGALRGQELAVVSH